LRVLIKYFVEKPGFWPPLRKFQETGFFARLRVLIKYFVKKPGFWPPLRPGIRLKEERNKTQQVKAGAINKLPLIFNEIKLI